MTCYRLGDKAPSIDRSAFVAAEATLIGAVTLGADCSVWPGAVIRADNAPITLAEGCNVQEGAVLHVDPGHPLTLGAGVTVGHQAMLHGCTVGEGSLIGIQAVVLNGAVIGRNCLVAAGSLVPEGRSYPDGCLLMGTPAKVVRELDADGLAALRRSGEGYVAKARQYLAELAVVPAAAPA